MSIEIESANRILEEYRPLLEENSIVPVRSYEKAHSMWTHYYDITLRTSPLPIGDKGFDYNIASQIAAETKVVLKKSDFGRGEDEIDYRNVFSVNCRNEEDIKNGIMNLIQAKKTLNRKLLKLNEFIGSL